MSTLSNRRLISDQQLIQTLVSELTLLETKDGGWTKTYLDPSANQTWTSTFLNGENHGGGQQVLLKSPTPTTQELISIAVSTDIRDERVAACLLLLENEKVSGIDFRERILDQLAKSSNETTRNEIVKLTDLTSSLNRQDVLNKTFEDVQAAADYYAAIAEKAKRLVEEKGYST